MIFVNTPYNRIYEVFALEYWLATEKDLGDDVFLLWSTVPTMVCGKYQNPYEEINMDYVRKNNVLISRRLSGGGTMYVDQGGMQFTFITRDSDKEISFEKFVYPVVDALKKLGVEDVTFTGRNDILVCGKKVSGNSQYKVKGCTVHHGTLLYNTDLEQVVRSTTPDEQKIISKSIKSVRERVTNISEHMNRVMTIDEFKEALINEITAGGKRYELTEEERGIIEKMSAEKFATKEFIFGNTPKFEIEKKGYFKGGKVTIGLTVNKGKISATEISGDFFGTISKEEFSKLLTGVTYEREAVKSALQKLQGNIYNVSEEELLGLLF